MDPAWGHSIRGQCVDGGPALLQARGTLRRRTGAWREAADVEPVKKGLKRGPIPRRPTMTGGGPPQRRRARAAAQRVAMAWSSSSGASMAMTASMMERAMNRLYMGISVLVLSDGDGDAARRGDSTEVRRAAALSPKALSAYDMRTPLPSFVTVQTSIRTHIPTRNRGATSHPATRVIRSCAVPAPLRPATKL